MPKRSKEWNLSLTTDLRDRRFAQEFILASLDEDIPLQVALGKVIRAHGIREFAQRIKMAPSNVSRAINPRHNITHKTLNSLLEAFDLVLTVKPKTGALPAAKRRKTSSHCEKRANRSGS